MNLHGNEYKSQLKAMFLHIHVIFAAFNNRQRKKNKENQETHNTNTHTHPRTWKSTITNRHATRKTTTKQTRHTHNRHTHTHTRAVTHTHKYTQTRFLTDSVFVLGTWSLFAFCWLAVSIMKCKIAKKWRKDDTWMRKQRTWIRKPSMKTTSNGTHQHKQGNE